MAEYIRASREGLFGMTSGDLDILVFAGVGHGWQEYPGTPSWAPNLPGMKRKDGKGCPVGSFRPINFYHLFLSWFEKAKLVGPDMLSVVLILDTVQHLGPVRGDLSDANAGHEALAIIPWIVDFATSRQKYVTGCHPLVALHSMLHFESGIQERGPGLGILDFGNTTSFVH
ncbi:Protein kinase domain-containing protein [Fusarium sp. LHS14.1]|nr:Protein kinase domain-containing protein [Fusarium sp. LHS14.1]